MEEDISSHQNKKQPNQQGRIDMREVGSTSTEETDELYTTQKMGQLGIYNILASRNKPRSFKNKQRITFR